MIARGVLLALSGLIVGLIASVGLTQVLGTMLVGVTPADPATLGAVAMLIMAVAAAACLLPAWRAIRVNPLSVLRES